MITRISALFLAVAASGMAQTNTWELAHPDAKVLIGMDLKGLRDSPAGQAFTEQFKAKATAAPASGMQGMMMGMAGEMLKGVDRIFISSPAIKPAASGKIAAAAQNPAFLLIVEGTLPLEQLTAFLPGTPHRYHDVDVFRGAKATDSSYAMLDTRTVILGDEKSVLAAIDRRGHGAGLASPLFRRARELASGHELWIIADDSLSKFQPAGAAANPLVAQIASQIKGLDMGLEVHNGFQFEMSLATESETTASQMAKMLNGQLSLAMLTQANNAQAAEMARRLSVETQGARMRLSFALTADEFAQQLQTAKAQLAARQQSGGQPGLEPRAAQPKPSTPGKVKIYGLDEGVREIQLTH